MRSYRTHKIERESKTLLRVEEKSHLQPRRVLSSFCSHVPPEFPGSVGPFLLEKRTKSVDGLLRIRRRRAGAFGSGRSRPPRACASLPLSPTHETRSPGALKVAAMCCHSYYCWARLVGQSANFLFSFFFFFLPLPLERHRLFSRGLRVLAATAVVRFDVLACLSPVDSAAKVTESTITVNS